MTKKNYYDKDLLTITLPFEKLVSLGRLEDCQPNEKSLERNLDNEKKTIFKDKVFLHSEFREDNLKEDTELPVNLKKEFPNSNHMCTVLLTAHDLQETIPVNRDI